LFNEHLGFIILAVTRGSARHKNQKVKEREVIE
jgi:hypothetical protein